MIIEGSVLAELCNVFHYPVEKDQIVLFAFRGCLPGNLSESNVDKFTDFKSSYNLKSIQVNYLNPRCTIGIWNRITDKIALFPGSTLPSKDYVKRNPSSVSTLNVLCPGCYQLRKGIHPRKENGFQPHKALLMDGFGMVGLPHVGKTKASSGFNSRISNYDVILPGDNLHAARMEPIPKFYSSLMKLRYSSSGCITIVGQPSEYLKYNHPYTGWNSWDSFMENVSSFEQKNFSFLLFNFSDLKRRPIAKTEVIRYGSKQRNVGNIQYLLSNILNITTGQFYYSGDLDCSFSDQTALSYCKFLKDYSSSKTKWEIEPHDFFNQTKHFNSTLIQPENAIH